MTKKRAELNLDDDQIDLEELIDKNTQLTQIDQKKLKDSLDKVGALTGFVSRQPTTKKPRKRSPYLIQKNIKMRVGMAELLVELTQAAGSASDQETLELAIGSLIKELQLKGLHDEYENLIRTS